jgi:membrane protein implicated in regulation of membrane protease activity
MILFGITILIVLVMIVLRVSWKYILCFLFNMILLTAIDKLIGRAVHPKKGENNREDTH